MLRFARSRAAAIRLEALPLLRCALATGCISWSKAELLTRVADPENEARWLDLAERHTLREWRREVSTARNAGEMTLTEEREAMGTLTCTLDREDAWLLEATRTLLDQLGTRGAEARVEALLAEAQGALLAALPAEELNLEGWSQRRRRSGAGESSWRTGATKRKCAASRVFAL